MSGKLSTNGAQHRWADEQKSSVMKQNISLPALWKSAPKIAKFALPALLGLWLLRGVVGWIFGALFSLLALIGGVILAVAVTAFVLTMRKK